MHKFGVGDLVKVILGTPELLKEGSIYRVANTDSYVTYLSGFGVPFRSDRFELHRKAGEYLEPVKKAKKLVKDKPSVKLGRPCKQSLNHKDTNPKDAVGIKKIPFSTISAPVLAEVGIAMLEGARKYGRHNYRIASVRYSVYYDASMRHLTAAWEGQDIDPDSGLSHVTKAIASLVVLRDAMIQGKLVDDRPPSTPDGWQQRLQGNVDAIFERHPVAAEAYTINSIKTTVGDV